MHFFGVWSFLCHELTTAHIMLMACVPGTVTVIKQQLDSSHLHHLASRRQKMATMLMKTTCLKRLHLKKRKEKENEMQKCIYIPTHFSKTVLFCQPHQQLFTHSNTYSNFINKNSLLVMQTWQNETEKRKKTTTASNNNEALVPLYWAIQAGLLTPLTFARHRLSPLAAFTSGAYFLHNGR